MSVNAISRSLTWREALTAFWSIYWPAWAASAILVIPIAVIWDVSYLERGGVVLALAGQLTFFACHAALVPRLFCKQYQTFQIELTDAEGIKRGEFSRQQLKLVVRRILIPQVVLMAILMTVAMWMDERSGRGLASSVTWFRLLVLGPIAVQYAVSTHYPDFSLSVVRAEH